MGEGRAVCVFGSCLYQSRISPAVTNEEGRGGKNNTVKKKEKKETEKEEGGRFVFCVLLPFFCVRKRSNTHMRWKELDRYMATINFASNPPRADEQRGAKGKRE